MVHQTLAEVDGQRLTGARTKKQMADQRRQDHRPAEEADQVERDQIAGHRFALRHCYDDGGSVKFQSASVRKYLFNALNNQFLPNGYMITPSLVLVNHGWCNASTNAMCSGFEVGVCDGDRVNVLVHGAKTGVLTDGNHLSTRTSGGLSERKWS